jgi:hypothetical protein
VYVPAHVLITFEGLMNRSERSYKEKYYPTQLITSQDEESQEMMKSSRVMRTMSWMTTRRMMREVSIWATRRLVRLLLREG